MQRHTLFRVRSALCAGLLACTLGAGPALALTLSPAHLEAAERLGCVLADDALGQLDDAQFNSRFDAAVRGFDDRAVDVIYAKALGYVDGLLFGASMGPEAEQRLRAFAGSASCSAQVASESGRRAVAL
jgi:hypothetical protein